MQFRRWQSAGVAEVASRKEYQWNGNKFGGTVNPDIPIQ
jgi:hypothetical protein